MQQDNRHAAPRQLRNGSPGVPAVQQPRVHSQDRRGKASPGASHPVQEPEQQPKHEAVRREQQTAETTRTESQDRRQMKQDSKTGARCATQATDREEIRAAAGTDEL